MNIVSECLHRQIELTQTRFQENRDSREAIRSPIQRGEYATANSYDDMSKRLSHLGMPPSTRSSVEIVESMRGTTEAITLERVLGRNNLMPISFLPMGAQRSRAVGRIHIRNQFGQRIGFGTGSLVSPNLVLTNNHVLPEFNVAEKSSIEFDFESDSSGKVRDTLFFDFDPTQFFYTDTNLDFSLVFVSPNIEMGRKPQEWGWSRLREIDPARLIVKGEYVTIIQHPNGEAKQIALRENQIIDVLDNFVHYETDTAPGSSGAPVFNDQWELLALHHSGVPQRDANGDILTIDGRKWEEAMGDHRIKWIANEGVLCSRIVDFVKRLTLNGSESRLRDELFDLEPPSQNTGVKLIRQAEAEPNNSSIKTRAENNLSNPNEEHVMATWTIPLNVTVSVGQADLRFQAFAAGAAQTPRATLAVDNSELQRALDEFSESQTRTYFDHSKDVVDREQYYAEIDADELSPDELFRLLSKLLTDTHRNKLSYSPSTNLYPWVDLHPDRKLRSIYSGKTFTAEELIREDFRIAQERAQALREMVQRESLLGTDLLHERVDALEASLPFNCEHVVPQSWFNKRQPMRGDLHHLFACESGCNSFRGNIPYFDFPDFKETVRDACGKRETNKFEPSHGKGAVARATLYFLLRYPRFIGNSTNELRPDRLETLLKWHGEDPVSDHERHRNQVIYEKQGNRNPLIDWSEWAERITFFMGLS